ncbi:GRAM domain-containing protein 2A isoform X5 [Phyllopteryx taeniolatus]|uniref:GRAM domain-containing protein 2A isoform X5 n=1 Tax=Phyllopteryx taeniolatus TaxID=161469 RepID=UPI002AD4883D|nr:GRAM domain-containing protein 2A isoform X5 [Phyllopteryx taeniolatus]
MAFPIQQLAAIRIGQAAPRKDTLLDTEAVSQEVFMGCTIYAASPKALPVDEAVGQDTYYQPPPCRHLHGNCSQRIVRARSMTEQQEHSEETGLLSTQDPDASKDEDAHGHLRFQLIEELSYEDVKKCYRGSCVSCSDLLQAMDECVCVYGANVLSLVQSSPPLRERVVSATVSKYNSQYHKLFQCVPKDELLMKVYSCALLRDILLQGRLYISRNWLCFYANLFGKDIKVAIPVVSVRLVKKHKTAGLVPNGLAITTDTGQKYVFVSLLSRDSVYDVLRRICTHLQVNGKSLSLKQYMEEPTLSLDEFPTPDEFPAVDEFPSVLKWRRKPSVASVSSSLPDLLGNSSSSLSAVSTPFKSEQPLEERALQTDRGLLSEPVAELGHMEYQLLKFFTLLIILLILSSCYLAFRVCSLEQQLSFLSNPHLPLRERSL